MLGSLYDFSGKWLMILTLQLVFIKHNEWNKSTIISKCARNSIITRTVIIIFIRIVIHVFLIFWTKICTRLRVFISTVIFSISVVTFASLSSKTWLSIPSIMSIISGFQSRWTFNNQLSCTSWITTITLGVNFCSYMKQKWNSDVTLMLHDSRWR